jgi:hypothetical protein
MSYVVIDEVHTFEVVSGYEGVLWGTLYREIKYYLNVIAMWEIIIA